MRTKFLGILAAAVFAVIASSAPAAAFQWQNNSHSHRGHAYGGPSYGAGVPKVFYGQGAYKVQKRRSENWFDHADRNHDGTLTYREYRKAVKKQWKSRAVYQGYSYGKPKHRVKRHAHRPRIHHYGYAYRPHHKPHKRHHKRSHRRPVIVFQF